MASFLFVPAWDEGPDISRRPAPITVSQILCDAFSCTLSLSRSLLRGVVQMKRCSDFSVSADSQGLARELLQQQKLFYMSQFWVSVEIYLFLQAVSSEKHLYAATGSLFFFLLHRKDWKTSETATGRFAESLILPGATWLKSSCQEHWLIRAIIVLAVLHHREI